MELRRRPIEQTATLDGREILVRVGLPEDGYVAERERETVFAELFEHERALASVATVLDPGDTRAARELAREIVSGLERGSLEPTAAALEPLADRPAR